MEVIALVALIIFLYWREEQSSPNLPNDEG